ncbi:39S ribosomal protein L33, mitochondrial-like [Acipenser oxyrinchus oxyrinchus]|uniref:Large ribosomal subunit protein bL33m n=1 Tax=Acipenser oxyrinchus oxyrinchus TaxID=40147 RepID=A0AAD8GBC4_ACIOX|nr:39S ribosomal protein L33, mitochondrial-like [Acipenser oxyrinchus oxyrinchus]
MICNAGLTVRCVCFRTLLVQMMSAAGTGYCFNTKRNRLREKLVLRKHDPKVNKHVLFFEKKKIRSI